MWQVLLHHTSNVSSGPSFSVKMVRGVHAKIRFQGEYQHRRKITISELLRPLASWIEHGSPAPAGRRSLLASWRFEPKPAAEGSRPSNPPMVRYFKVGFSISCMMGNESLESWEGCVFPSFLRTNNYSSPLYNSKRISNRSTDWFCVLCSLVN